MIEISELFRKSFFFYSRDLQKKKKKIYRERTTRFTILFCIRQYPFSCVAVHKILRRPRTFKKKMHKNCRYNKHVRIYYTLLKGKIV